MDGMERIAQIVRAVRDEYAPDPRLAVFEVEVSTDEHLVSLLGATSEPTAAEALHRRIALLDLAREVEDRIARLPDPAERRTSHALVTASVAPMLSDSVVSGIHVSQALLGHRLLVLRERGRWLQCRSADGYLGWIHRGYLHRVEETEARQWEMAADGAACLSLEAEVRGEGGEVLARLPWGARFALGHDGRAYLPDGSAGAVAGEWVALAEQEGRFPQRGEAVVATAARWIGAPYLWGGITRAGVDCSGLVQAAYRTHGVDLPRDSDQQAATGAEVDPGDDFSRLRPGDLLFFAEDPGRVTHVTMSAGGSRIVHSSLGNGGVRRNDLNGSLAFERELRELFVCARRILPDGA